MNKKQIKLEQENQRLRKELDALKLKFKALSSRVENSPISDYPSSPQKISGDLKLLRREHFNLLFEKSPEGVFLVDADGMILELNTAFAQQLKLQKENIIGTYVYDYLEDSTIFEQGYKKLLKEKFLNSDIIQKATDGSLQKVRRKVFITEGSVETDTVLVISTVLDNKTADNSGDEQTQNELRIINRQLSELNKMHESVTFELNKGYQALHEAYRQLKESEEKYRIISENTGDFIFKVKYIKGKPVLVYASPSVKKMGYTQYDILGTSPLSYIDDKMSIRTIKNLYTRYKDGDSTLFHQDFKLRAKVQKKDHKFIFLDCTINISQNHVVIIAKDVTELIAEIKRNVRSKKIIKEAERNYRYLFNSSLDIFLYLDENLKIIQGNASAVRILGYSPEEFEKIQINDILTPEGEFGFNNLHALIADSGNWINESYTFKAKKKNNEHLWMSGIFQSTTFNRKKAVFITLRDIDQFKKSQEELKESNQKFKMLADAGTSGIFIYQGTKIVFVNNKIEQMLGYSFEELKGKNFWDVVHPDMQSTVKERGLRRLKGEQVTDNYEMKLISKKGTTKWIDFSTGYITYKGKSAAIANIVDITKHKETQIQLLKAKERAEASDKLKSAFLSNMSHEIRTPMNGIIGFAQLLDSDNLSKEKRKSYFSVIQNSSNQLLRIIDDILDISKIEVGEMTLTKKETGVTEVVNNLFELFTQKISEQKPDIKLKKDIPKADVILNTDKVRLQQILTNLLSNAVKYTNAGEITLGYRKKNSKLLFFVKDTGVGIDDETGKVIFSRFGRSVKEHIKKIGGTGLGLSISMGLVKLLGGEIYYESDGKTGTTFFFTHPLITK